MIEDAEDPGAVEAPTTLRRGGVWGGWVVAGLVVALGGLLVATGLGRTVRSPGPVLAVVVTFLPYLYLAIVGLGFGAWCVLPDRRTLPLLLGAALLTAAVLYGPSWPAHPEEADGTGFVAMSWNVQRLWGDGHADPRRCVAEVLAAQDPDVVTLLEISRTGLDALASELGLACVHTDYYGTGSDDVGGLAVCVDADHYAVSGGGQRFVDGDDWRYVLAEVRGRGVVFNVLGVHLHPYWPLTGAGVRAGVGDLAAGRPGPLLDASERGTEVIRIQGAQSVALLERVGRLSDPTLVIGDFNSTRDAALHARLREILTDTWERGGVGFGPTVRVFGWIPLRVDYVYASDAFAVRRSRVLDVACSDHRPVVSDLILRPVAAPSGPADVRRRQAPI